MDGKRWKITREESLRFVSAAERRVGGTASAQAERVMRENRQSSARLAEAAGGLHCVE